MPIQNINGKTVYVITPTKVEASKDSTGNSWATMYARQRQNIWDQLALNAANEQELALKQRKLINDRIMNLEDTIGQLQRGELDARKAIEMNNADNITQIEKAKLQAAEVVTSSRVSSGSGRGGGYGYGDDPTGPRMTSDERSEATAIAKATAGKLPVVSKEKPDETISAIKTYATQLDANLEAKGTSGVESNALNRDAVNGAAALGAWNALEDRLISAGYSEDEISYAANDFQQGLKASTRELLNKARAAEKKAADSGSGDGGGAYSSTSSYRKATPQAAIAAAQPGLTDVAPDAAAAITGLQDKVAQLETQLGGISGGETTRQRFAQEVGGIWGFAERPNYMQSYQEPAGTVDRIGQLVDSYKVIARKALVERAAQNAAKDKTTPIPVTDDMVTQYAMKMLRDDISKGREGSIRPVTEDEYMRNLRERPSTSDTVARLPMRDGKPDMTTPEMEEPKPLEVYSPPYEPTIRAKQSEAPGTVFRSPDRNDEELRNRARVSPLPPMVSPGEAKQEKPEPQTSTDRLRRQRVNETLADILTADKVSDENPNIARQNRDTLVGKIARMEKDPNKALIEIDRAYEGDEKALKKNRNIYLAMYLAGEKDRA